jgi:hypothetical protein
MGSKQQVRLLPALLRGCSSAAERSPVERVRTGSNPVIPASRGGCGVTAAFEVVILAAPVRSRSATLSRTLSVKRSRARRRGPERAGYLDGLASPYMARGVRVLKSGPRSTTATARSAALVRRRGPEHSGYRRTASGYPPARQGPQNPNRSASHDRDDASNAAGRRVPVIGYIERSRVRFPLVREIGR